MTKQSSIFPEKEITPAQAKAKRMIIIARAVLAFLSLLLLIGIISKNKYDDAYNMTLLGLELFLLIYTGFNPLRGLSIAALVTCGQVIYVLYLNITFYLDHARLPGRTNTIIFLILMTTATVIFIIAGKAAEKLSKTYDHR